MIFVLRRTSRWDEEIKPLEDDRVKKISITRAEIRMLNTPEEFDARFSKSEGKWLEVGTNHRHDARGYITRDREQMQMWGIEIDTIEDLLNLMKLAKQEIVIHSCMWNNDVLEIEIYDTWRE